MRTFYKNFRGLIEQFDDPSLQPPQEKLSFEKNPRLVSNLVKAIRAYLDETNPYFGELLDAMKIVITNEVRTMAVDNNRNIYINPDFTVKLCAGHIDLIPEEGTNKIVNFKIRSQNSPFLFVICHEIYHIFNETFAREKGRRHVIHAGNRPINLWNIATDIEMNYRLQHSFGLLPPENIYTTNPDGSIYIYFLNRMFNISSSRAEIIYREMLEAALEIEELQKKYPPFKPAPPEPGDQQPEYSVGDRVYKEEEGAGETKPMIWYEVVSLKKNGDPVLKELPLMPSMKIKVELLPERKK